ncbi:hypothetical protein [Flavobacterium anhuiense]|uniref:hypothetical protein n=1 Tax=Flavobacterium anhuiense TaxID=459526 RepID=UPI003D976EEF
MEDASIELAKNVVVNYKDVTSWILLSVIIIIGIVRYFQSLKLSKTIETFKAELSKKEIKFTRHTELQIECLKKMYDMVVAYHYSFMHFTKPSYLSHNLLKSNLTRFQETYALTIQYCHRNRILLTDEITAQAKILQEKSEKIEKVCIVEYNLLIEREDQGGSQTDMQRIYGTSENEIKAVSHAVIRINANDDVKSFEGEIIKLRELIENYFKQLVG